MIFVDNCTLSALYKLKQLSLLSHRFSKIIIPLEVINEFSEQWKNVTLPNEYIVKEKPPTYPKHLLSNPLYARLGRGEQSAIAWAIQTGSLFCSDDLHVRKMAEKLSVPVIGTLGLCKLAYKQHYFNNPSEYRTIIDLLSQDLRLSPELIRWAKNIED